MTTTTLSSRGRFGNLLGGMLKKNFAMSVYLFVAMFIFFPLQMLLETNHALKEIARAAVNGSEYWGRNSYGLGIYTPMSMVVVAIILLAGAGIIGLLQTAGMHNKRSVDLFHSLPVTRTQLMCGWMLSGFLTIVVPFLLNYAINLAVSFYRQGAVNAAVSAAGLSEVTVSQILFAPIAWDIFGWMVTIFATMSVVMLISTQVGSVFENFVFSVEILVAPIVILLMNELFFDNFLVGYSANSTTEKFLSVTPITIMIGKYSTEGSSFFNWIILLWLVLGTLIFLAALYLYRRRHSEIAETSGCHGALGVLFTAIAVYVCAPVVGVLLAGNSGDEAGPSKWLYLAGVAVGAVLSFLLVEAVLNRGFAGLHKRFLRGGITCGAVTLLSLALITGGLGYEQRLPSEKGTQSATINYRGWYDYVSISDYSNTKRGKDRNGNVFFNGFSWINSVTFENPENIGKIIDMHRRLIAVNSDSYEGTAYNKYSLRYKTGLGEMHRRYDRTNVQVEALLAAMEETDELQQQTNPLLIVDATNVRRISLYDNLGFFRQGYTKSNDIAALIAQLNKDAKANGTIDFTNGSKPVCYIAVETVTFTGNEHINPPTGKSPESFSVPIFASYTNTLNYLGRELTAPAKVEDITVMGVNDYSRQKRSSAGFFVSQVGDYELFGGNEYTYAEFGSEFSETTDNREYISLAVEKQINTHRQQDEWLVTADSALSMPVAETNTPKWLYCTFAKGDEIGVTVMLDASEITLKDFPLLSETNILVDEKYVKQG